VTNTVAFDFTGTSVVVTGGTSGIGHAVAGAFRDAGANVIITGTRPSAADYHVDLGGFGYHPLELTNSSSVDAFVASLDAVDVLVNNAGANFPGGRDEWEPETFATAIALNLTGPMRLTMACQPLLARASLDGGSSVISMVSASAFRNVPLVPGYAAAKAGLRNLTANLAERWWHAGIRVNAVVPGVIDTPMTQPMATFPELVEAELARIPAGRFGTPEEVVGAVLFLASSAASYITGHVLAVDGGYLIA
jgi:NAD(P)-dependent dehydrogenase (short-subunit alcohol dehydrogenase family)